MTKLPGTEHSSQTDNSNTSYGVVSIGEAASLLNISPDTLRAWEKQGKITPPTRTIGGIRKYRLSELIQVKDNNYSTATVIVEQVARIKHNPLKTFWILNKHALLKGTLLAVLTLITLSEGITMAYTLKPEQTKKLVQMGRSNPLTALVIRPADSLAQLTLQTTAPAKAHEIGFLAEKVVTPTVPELAVRGDLNQILYPTEAIAAAPEAGSSTESAVLGTRIGSPSTVLEINVDTHFNGNVTAPNILNSLSAGENASVTSGISDLGNTPTISLVLPPSLVNTINGSQGALQIKADSGSDLSVTTSNSGTGASLIFKVTSDLGTVRGRGGCGSCITDSDVSDSLTLGSGSNISGSAVNTGVVLGAFGGTGLTSYTTGDIIYSAGGSTLTKLNIGTTGKLLGVGAGNLPTWMDGGCPGCLVRSPSSNTVDTQYANVIQSDTANIVGLTVQSNSDSSGSPDTFDVLDPTGATKYLSVAYDGTTTVNGVLNFAGGTTYKVGLDGVPNFASIQGTAIGTTTPRAGNFTSIGATNPGTGSFTTIAASGTVTATNLNTAAGTVLCFNGSNQIVTCKIGTSSEDLQTGYTGGGTIATSAGNNIGVTLASGLVSSTSFSLTDAGTATAFVINDTNTGATNTAIDLKSSGTSKFSIDELGNITAAGNVATTGSGTLTSNGLLTGTAGITISGGNVSINATGTGSTAIGNPLAAGTFQLASSTLNIATNGTVTGGSISGSTNTLTNVPYTALTNTSITVTAGTGLSGGGAVTLGSSVSLANAGVLSLAGTSNQVLVNSGTSAQTGAVTLSLPQSIGTGSSPAFSALTLSNTTNQITLGTTKTTTISSTAPSGSRTYTIPDFGSDDTFAGVAATQTLTNKTISGSSNTLSTIGNGSLTNSTIQVADGTAITGGTASLGGSLTLTNVGVTSLTGTSNQISVDSSTGNITLTTPQSLATSSSVQFAGLTLSGSTTGSGYVQTYSSGTTSSAATFNVTNSNSTATPTNIIGLNVQLAGTAKDFSLSNTNTLYGLQFPTLTTATNNTFNAITFGTGYDNFITSSTLNITAAGVVTGASIAGNTNTFSTGSIPNSALTNTTITINAGTGLTGGGSITLGGSGAALSNAGVTSIIGTSEQTTVNGVLTAQTGAVTLGLAQSIGTTSSTQFAGMTLTGGLTFSGITTDITSPSSQNIAIVPDGTGKVGIGSATPTSLFSVGSSNQFQVDSSGNIVKLNNVTYSFPSAQAAGSSYTLQTDGSGTLTWVPLLSPTACTPWSCLTDPTLNLSLSMGSNTTTFTYGSTTGSSNLFNFTDTSSNSGTGYLVNITNASNSTLKPFHVGTTNGATATDSITVASTGAVGIGNSTPTSLLSIGTSEALKINGSGQVTFNPSTTTPAANISNSQTAISAGSTGTWAALNTLPEVVWEHSGVITNGYIYTFGGFNSGGSTLNKVYKAQMKADGTIGTWSTLATMPSELRGHSVVSYNNFIFVTGGEDNSDVFKSTVYSAAINSDGTLGTWSTLATMPALTAFHESVAFNGYLYVFGGCNSTCATSDVRSTIYSAPINGNGTVGAWTTLTQTLPQALMRLKATQSNGYVFIAGGSNDGTASVSTVYSAPLKADGTIGAWNTLNTLPALNWKHSLTVSNGYLYVGGGRTSSTVYSAQISSAGTIGTWATLNTLPALNFAGVMLAGSGYLWLTGGNNNVASVSTVYSAPLGSTALVSNTSSSFATGNLLDVWNSALSKTSIDYSGNVSTAGYVSFNPTSSTPTANLVSNVAGISNGSTGSYATLNTLPQAFNRASTVNSNGYLYVMGGFGSVALSTVYSAKTNSDGTIGSWQTLNTLPQTIYRAAGASYNGYIFLTGGFNGTAEISTVYSAKTNSDGTIGSWNTLNTLPALTRDHGATVSNGYLIITNGWNGTTLYSTAYSAPMLGNGTIGTWNTLTVVPVLLREPSLTSYNGYIFVTGGLTSGSVTRSTVYSARVNSDGTIGSWATLNTMPGVTRAHSSLAFNGYLYVIGGSPSAESSLVYSAPINSDGTVGAWATLKTMPAATMFLGAAVSNGYLYLAGGSIAGSVMVSTVYSAPLQSTAETFNTTNTFTAGNLLDVWNAGNSVFSVDANGGVNTNTGVTINQTSTTPTANLQNSLVGLNAGGIGSYQTVNPLPATRFTHASVSYNGYVYIIGGMTGASSNISTVYSAQVNADGSLSQWATLNTLPAILGANGAVVVNGYLIVMGGQSTGATAVSTVYSAQLKTDGTIGTWATLSTLPAVVNFHSLATYGNYIFLAGGCAGGCGAVSTVYSVAVNGNGTIGTWQTLNTLPQIVGYNATVAYNGYLYSVGGFGSAYLSVVYSAPIRTDGTIGAWSSLNTIPQLLRGASAFVANGYLTVAGGYNGSLALSTVYSAKINADGTVGTWTTMNTLPALLYQASTAVVNGYVVMAGGWNATTAVSAVYTAPLQSSAFVMNTKNTFVSGTLAEVWNNNASVAGVSSTGQLSTSGGIQITPATQAPTSNFTSTLTGLASGSLGTWTQTTQMPIVNRGFVYGSYNGYIFQVSGCSSSCATATVASAKVNTDGTVGTWQSISQVPVALRLAGGAVYNNTIFLVGGCGSTCTTFVSTVYSSQINNDGTIGTWTTLNTLPAVMYFNTAIASNGYLFVAGGCSAGTSPCTTFLSTLYSAPINSNGSIGTWQTLNTLPTLRIMSGLSAANGYLILTGGTDGTTAYSTTYTAAIKSDGTIGTWNTTTTLPTVVFGHSSVISNNYIYVTGGCSTATSSIATCASVLSTTYSAQVKADGTLGAWVSMSTLPTTTFNHGAAIVNGYAVVYGGQNSASAAVSTVYTAPLQSTNFALNTSSTYTAGNLVDLWNNGSSKFSVDYAGNVLTSGVTLNNASTTPSGNFNSNLNGIGAGGLGSWSTLNTLPTTIAHHALTVYNGYAYILGGLGAGATSSAVYYARLNTDGTIGNWSTTTALPVVRQFGAALAYGGYIFFGGGSSNNGATTTSTIYSSKINSDGTLSTWNTLATMPQLIAYHEFAQSNGYLFLLGGTTNAGTGATSTVYSAQILGNGTLGTWQTLNTLPTLGSRTYTAAYNNYLFSMGGFDASASISIAYSAPVRADGTIGTWATLNTLPTQRYNGGPAVIANGYIYMIAGTNSSSVAISTVWSAKINSDGTLGSWVSLPTTPAPMRSQQSIAYGNYIYTFGGLDGSNNATSVAYSAPIQSNNFTFQSTNTFSTGNLLEVWNNNSTVFGVDTSGKLNTLVGVQLTQTSTTPTANFQTSLTGLGGGSIGTWSTINPLPVTLNRAASANYNGYIYMLGGMDASTVLSTVYAAKTNVDGTIAGWQTLNTLPAIRRDAAAVAANGYLFVLGGYTGGAALSTVYSAKINPDGSIGPWNTLSTLPAIVSLHKAVFVNGYIVYTAGTNNDLYTGSFSTTYSAQVLGNGTLGTWQTLNTLPALQHTFGMTTYNGWIYVAGGRNSGNSLVSTVYATKVNSDGTVPPWASLQTLPATNQGPMLEAANGYLYTIGGCAGGVCTSSQSLVYSALIKPDGTLDRWQRQPNLPMDLSYTAGGIVNGYAYVLGGQITSGAAVVSTAYSAPIQSSAFVYSMQNALSAGNLIDVWNNNSSKFSVDYAGNLNTASGVTINNNSQTPYATLASSVTSIDAGGTGSYTTTSVLPFKYFLIDQSTVSYGDYIYVIGGYCDSGASCPSGSSENQSTVYSAKVNNDGTVSGWTALNTLPVKTQTTAVAANGYIFVFGGITSPTNTIVSTVYSAKINSDGTIGSWNTLSTLPATTEWMSATSYNGYVFVGGGQLGAGGRASTIYSAQIQGNGILGSWQTLNTMPVSVYDFTLIASSGYLFTIGGTTASTGISVTYSAPIKADGTIGTWSTLATTLPNVITEHDTVAYNGYLYVVGGYRSDGTTNFESAVFSAKVNTDGTLSTWTKITSLPNNLGYPGAVVVKGSLFVLGGENNSFAGTTTVYSAPLQSSALTLKQATTLTSGNLLDLWNSSQSKFSVDVNGNINTNSGVTFNPLTGTPAAQFASSLSGVTAGSTGTWQTLANFPDPGSYKGMVAYNGYLFTTGGNPGTPISTVYSAQINSDGTIGAWAKLNTLPSRMRNHVTIAASGYLYVLGGTDGTSQLSTVYSAKINSDGTIGVWATLNTLPALSSRAGGVAYNGYLYFFGGSPDAVNTESTVYSAVYSAAMNTDGTLGTWQTLSTMPTVRFAFGYTAYNGFIFILGGSSSVSVPVSTVYSVPMKADGTIGTWKTLTALPVVMAEQTVAAYNGYLYQFGGATVSTAYSAKISSDGTIGSWSTLSTLPITIRGSASTVSNGYVFVNGGVTSTSTLYSAPLQSSAFVFNTNNNLTNGNLVDVWNSGSSKFAVDYAGNLSIAGKFTSNVTQSLDGSISATWQTLNTLPALISRLRSVVVNGYIFVIGGCTTTCGALSTVYSAKLNSDGTLGTWATLNTLPGTRTFPTVVDYNGYIYVMGGRDDAPADVSTVYSAQVKADGTIGTWATLNTLPALSDKAAAVAYNGYIYYIGGTNNTTGAGAVSTIYSAVANSDGTIGSWTSLSVTLPSLTFAHMAVAANGYLFVLGGANGTDTRLSTAYSIPINANGTLGSTWNTLSNLPVILNGGVTQAYDGYLYVFGGTTGTVVSTVYSAPMKADGTIGTWATLSTMPAVVANYGGVMYNGYLYMAGGNNGTNDVSTTYSVSLVTSRAFVFNTTNPYPESNSLGGSADLINIQNNGDSRFVVDAQGNGKFAGTVYAAGAIIGTPGQVGDLAENITVEDQEIEAADVVAAYPDHNGLIKTQVAYDSRVLGVISTKASLTFSPETTNGRPVALAGRVPVKVSDENGPVVVGDYLTSSSTPGVAMKATRPGPVIGQALENAHDGKVLMIISLSFADPTSLLSKLVFDQDGRLLVDSLQVSSMKVAQNTVSTDILNDFNTLDLGQKLASLSNSTTTQAVAVDDLKAYVTELASSYHPELPAATLPDSSKVLAAQIASAAAALATDSAHLLDAVAFDQAQLEDINDRLITPQAIISSQSAILANLDISSTLSSLNLEAVDATFSGTFKALADSFLGTASFHDDVTVDGTFSITGGKALNAIGTLFIQKSPLASLVTFFEGLVTIDDQGALKTAGTVTTKNTITNQLVIKNTIGTDTIPAGSTVVTIKSGAVTADSKVFTTPLTQTSQALSVTHIKPGESFDIVVSDPASDDIQFNWVLVNTN